MISDHTTNTESMTREKSDDLYAQAGVKIGSFRFDAAVAEVFDDMISRSVPGYQQILSLLPTLTRTFQKPNKNYYDLGCSTGTGLLAMSLALSTDSSFKSARLIGIDSSPAMIERATEMLAGHASMRELDIELKCADLQRSHIQNAAMVLMNFTLQFIPLDQRSDLIERIYAGLGAGGALILSEKIQFDDAETDTLLTKLHHQFKADQGYSNLEISNKRDAIENVLIAETLPTHLQRLRRAGFRMITPWLQHLQFVSILAIK